MEHNDIDIGNWMYEGPKDFVIKLMDKFGTPSYIEKCPTTNEAYSVTFKKCKYISSLVYIILVPLIIPFIKSLLQT